jgi:hypothetical protein
MKRYVLGCCIAFLLACNNNDAVEKKNDDTSDTQVTKTGNGETEPKETTNANPDLSGCYLRAVKRDTLALSIQQTGNKVSGKLSFDNFQKDGSSGAVTGTIDQNILRLIYSFEAEGMHSVAEVYFKIDGNTLIHGTGEVGVKGDTAYYKDPDHLAYPETNRLKKIGCEELDKKYR